MAASPAYRGKRSTAQVKHAAHGFVVPFQVTRAEKDPGANEASSVHDADLVHDSNEMQSGMRHGDRMRLWF